MMACNNMFPGGAPCIPNRTHGYIFINGLPAPVGTKIGIIIDGTPCWWSKKVCWSCRPITVTKNYYYTTVTEGRYGFAGFGEPAADIEDPDCDRRGRKIEFTINDVLVPNTSIIFENGNSSKVNLYIGEKPKGILEIHAFLS